MKKRTLLAITGLMICILGCGRQETDWEPDVPEVLPSSNGIVTYANPQTEEITSLTVEECIVVSVTDAGSVIVTENGQEKEISLYGLSYPEGYSQEIKEHLTAILPETVYVEYTDMEKTEGYLWTENNVAMESNCMNYRMLYEGYAVRNPATDLPLEYEQAELWAIGTKAGLWKETDLTEHILLSGNSVSDNSTDNPSRYMETGENVLESDTIMEE